MLDRIADLIFDKFFKSSEQKEWEKWEDEMMRELEEACNKIKREGARLDRLRSGAVLH